VEEVAPWVRPQVAAEKLQSRDNPLAVSHKTNLQKKKTFKAHKMWFIPFKSKDTLITDKKLH
jgi:hypothetical protein